MTVRSHILLTGGTGFFGKALLRYWQEQEAAGRPMAHVTLLSRNPQHFAAQYPALVKRSWLTLAQGNICDAASLPRSSAFTHVMHAAADSTAGPQLTPQQRFDQIVDGTRNVLDLSVACGAHRFLLTSSGGVYGTPPTGMDHIVEDCHTMPDTLNAGNAYSVAKRMAEHLCALYTHTYGLQTTVARCFSFVGPDLPLDVHFAVGNFIRDALWADAIAVNGDGSPLRSYMDQADLAHWLLAILQHGRSGQAYNVGSPEAICIADLACLVRDTAAPAKQVHILGKHAQASPRNLYVPSVSKAYTELGLCITTPLREAIRRTVAFHQETPELGRAS